MLSITTDYIQDNGSPEPYLRRIAEAGFSHIHWCHHWNSDFVYSNHEIRQIARWLQAYSLQLNDVHASAGVEKAWLSVREYERLAGIELVKNRISMAARLAGDVIIIHVPAEPEPPEEKPIFWRRLQQSLDALEPFAKAHGVRLALENLSNNNFDTIDKLFARYGPDYLGLCYDSGHANIGGNFMDRLEPLKERLIALHLHDNDGRKDQHRLPFSGTIDWARLARLIAESAYTKCVNLEVSIRHTGLEDEQVFLEKAYAAGSTLTGMIDEHK